MKFLRSFVFSCLFFASPLLFALVQAPSAVRAPGEDYRSKIAPQYFFESEHGAGVSKSAVNSAVSVAELDVTQVQEWPAERDFAGYFQQIRDERFITSDPDFPRRSTWLYPDDGCYARAALAGVRSLEMELPAPSRIFVFGNLSVRSANSPSGEVSWWYHVVIGYRVNGEVMVVDPAIMALHPLKLEDWLAAMGDSGHMEVAFCSEGAYEPYSACQGGTPLSLKDALHYQEPFLRPEWRRLETLGRNPLEELGENPPWFRAEEPVPLSAGF